MTALWARCVLAGNRLSGFDKTTQVREPEGGGESAVSDKTHCVWSYVFDKDSDVQINSKKKELYLRNGKLEGMAANHTVRNGATGILLDLLLLRLPLSSLPHPDPHLRMFTPARPAAHSVGLQIKVPDFKFSGAGAPERAPGEEAICLSFAVTSGQHSVEFEKARHNSMELWKEKLVEVKEDLEGSSRTEVSTNSNGEWGVVMGMAPFKLSDAYWSAKKTPGHAVMHALACAADALRARASMPRAWFTPPPSMCPEGSRTRGATA